MEKIDFKKELKHLYNASAKQVSYIDVPLLKFVMVEGAGDPNTSALYAEAIEALFTLSYTLKSKIKKCSAVDYAVMPLEGLWWTGNPNAFDVDDRNRWQWTAMIMRPDYVTAVLFTEVAEVKKKNLWPLF